MWSKETYGTVQKNIVHPGVGRQQEQGIEQEGGGGRGVVVTLENLKWKDHFRDPSIEERIILKCILNVLWACRLDSWRLKMRTSGSVRTLMASYLPVIWRGMLLHRGGWFISWLRVPPQSPSLSLIFVDSKTAFTCFSLFIDFEQATDGPFWYEHINLAHTFYVYYCTYFTYVIIVDIWFPFLLTKLQEVWLWEEVTSCQVWVRSAPALWWCVWERTQLWCPLLSQ